MLQIVPHLKAFLEDHPNLWDRELLQIQEEAKRLEDLSETARKKNMLDEAVEVQCFNCSQPICTSEDIKTIQNAHHIVVNEDWADKLILLRSPVPLFEEEDLKYDGSAICSNGTCHSKVGGVCEYKHMEFPLLNIKCLRFVNKDGKDGRTYKKWKKINFLIEELSLDHLRQIVERKKAQM